MSLEDLDGSRKSLEVVLISSIVMGLIGGGGHPQVWRLISFAPFFGSRSPSSFGDEHFFVWEKNTDLCEETNKSQV